MSYTLDIHRRFFASHALRLYDGSVELLHAHDWGVEVRVAAARLDEIDLAMDFHALERIVADLLERLQGANLNEHPALASVNPSAERIAQYLYEQLRLRLPDGVKLLRITVTEAPGCRASFTAD